jgi:hypothetical protein
MGPHAKVASVGRFVSTCPFVLFRVGALVKGGTLKQQVIRFGVRHSQANLCLALSIQHLGGQHLGREGFPRFVVAAGFQEVLDSPNHQMHNFTKE